MTDFTSKRVGETEVFTVDYTKNLSVGETILSAVWTNSVKTGTDALPGSMIQGVATITGTLVSNKITGGIAGVYYAPICTATTSLGQILVLPEPPNGQLLVTN